MKYCLIITGSLAAIAVTFPLLVAIGYLLLIIPGLVLTCAPTAFIYLLSTAIIRRLLPIEADATATFLALAISVLIGWVVMQPARIKSLAQFEAQSTPDINPNAPSSSLVICELRFLIVMPNRTATIFAWPS